MEVGPSRPIGGLSLRPAGNFEIERVFREESGKARASLIRALGDIDLAEEAVQDAFVLALEQQSQLANATGLKWRWR